MKKLIKSAETVPDFRRPWGNLLHKLSDILVISFCAIICGAETYNDLEVFGNAKKIGFPTICRYRMASRTPIRLNEFSKCWIRILSQKKCVGF